MSLLFLFRTLFPANRKGSIKPSQRLNFIFSGRHRCHIIISVENTAADPTHSGLPHGISEGDIFIWYVYNERIEVLVIRIDAIFIMITIYRLVMAIYISSITSNTYILFIILIIINIISIIIIINNIIIITINNIIIRLYY